MIKYTPQHFLAYGILIYLILFIVGPYSFEIRNGWALLFLLGAYLLWILGIVVAQMSTPRIRNTERDRELSKFSEWTLIAIEGVTLLAALVWMAYFVVHILLGDGWGDMRLQATQMPFIFDIIQSETYVTIGVYVIVSYTKDVKSKLLKLLSKICILVPVVINLMLGARWTLFVVLLLFWIVECTKGKRRKIPFRHKVIICGVVAVLLVVCFILFAVRGVSATYTTEMPYYGTIETKGIWEFIGSSPLGKPVYSIFYYFTHSVPYYAQVFDMIKPERLYLGAYMFRIIGFFFNWFPDYKDVVNEIPCLVGSYSTFVTGYIRDWGIVGTLPMVFTTGLLMGKIQQLKKYNKLARCMRPYMLVMCILSPLYYNWHVGSIDFMIVLTIALHFMLKITNKIEIGRKE